MTNRRLAFVDTSAFKALADRSDRYHGDAVRIEEMLRREAWRLFSSNLVVAEAHALILTRLGRRPALSFLEAVFAGTITRLRVSEADEIEALDILRRYADKDFSLADTTSFVLMSRLGIDVAFSFDADFPRYGFRLLT